MRWLWSLSQRRFEIPPSRSRAGDAAGQAPAHDLIAGFALNHFGVLGSISGACFDRLRAAFAIATQNLYHYATIV